MTPLCYQRPNPRFCTSVALANMLCSPPLPSSCHPSCRFRIVSIIYPCRDLGTAGTLTAAIAMTMSRVIPVATLVVNLARFFMAAFSRFSSCELSHCSHIALAMILVTWTSKVALPTIIDPSFWNKGHDFGYPDLPTGLSQARFLRT